MSNFQVVFKLINGDQKLYAEITARDYAEVAGRVMSSKDGWFGTKGDLVNLSNVLTCQIIEIDENGYAVE